MALAALSRKAVAPVDEDTGAEVIAVTEQGDILSGEAISYSSLQDAIADLVKTIRDDEHAKLKMARIIRAIERQELYRQMPGITSMKAFFPVLLEKTASVGWNSPTSIKRYLGFYRLYIEQLELNPSLAIKAVSHLHVLYRLAQIDRKTGELVDPTKPGKLGPVQFEDISRLVIHMVTGFSYEQSAEGLDEAETLAELEAAGLGTQAGTYRELVGHDIKLPVKGWSVQDTERIVEAVVGTADEDGDEGEDEVQVVRVWVGYQTFDGAIHVERIEFRRGDAKLDEIEVGKTYTSVQFELLRGKDAAAIAGQDGEQAEGGE